MICVLCLGNNQLYILTVYNIDGKNVYSIKTTEEKIEFERNTLANGFYFIELKGNSTILRGKMIISK